MALCRGQPNKDGKKKKKHVCARSVLEFWTPTLFINFPRGPEKNDWVLPPELHHQLWTKQPQCPPWYRMVPASTHSLTASSPKHSGCDKSHTLVLKTFNAIIKFWAFPIHRRVYALAGKKFDIRVYVLVTSVSGWSSDACRQYPVLILIWDSETFLIHYVLELALCFMSNNFELLRSASFATILMQWEIKTPCLTLMTPPPPQLAMNYCLYPILSFSVALLW